MNAFHCLPNETKKLLKPSDMGLVYTSAQRIELGSAEIDSGSEEICLFVVQGKVAYTYGATQGTAQYKDMLYIPPGKKILLTSHSYEEDAVVIRFGAPCSRETEFAHCSFREIDGDDRHKKYGDASKGTKRDVWNYIDEKFNSSRFLVGICQGEPGAWTAWPPHKHGTKREEVYVYFGMGDGYALQCVYEDMDKPDAVALVKDGHLVAISEGYHPNVGCPKSGIQYIYCMVSVEAEDRDFMDLTMQSCYGDKL
ncbi:MAG: 5-deoxy-glucuronate isomerase [Defluviitaleaceae bacterium]|nr:5-deoxy-glucuronate isomerase [Defluviitaleaceae bacterium]